MTGREVPPVPPMFCRQCGYRLNGLPGYRCPECGESFHPDDPSSFDAKPPPSGWELPWAVVGSLLCIWLFLYQQSRLILDHRKNPLGRAVAGLLAAGATALAISAVRRTRGPMRVMAILLLLATLCFLLSFVHGLLIETR